jgi:hypothetical protein
MRISYVSLVLIQFLCIFKAKGGDVDYFEEFEQMLQDAENSRDLNEIIKSDLLGGYDMPKEISISCPSDPIVSIKDLATSEDDQDVSQCSVIAMNGPNFKFRFEVNCDNDKW